MGEFVTGEIQVEDAWAYDTFSALTGGEFGMFGEVGDSLGSLLEVNSLRGTMGGLAPPENADRFSAAVGSGS